jgi:endonuclease/exonuclease/phosphatase family metal-dependent hydrolase
MSWKTACTRMVTMIRLVPVEPTSGRSPIWVCNLHLDHQSAEARVNGAALVRDRIAARPEGMRDEPVVILGDFNATPGSSPVETLLAAGDDGAFVDAWAAVDARDEIEDGDHTRERPSGTWNGWDANARAGRIDFVLVRGMEVVNAEILHRTHDAGPLSDHWPVRATLALPTTAAKTTDASSVSAE